MKVDRDTNAAANRIRAAFEQGRRDAERYNGKQARYSDIERDKAYSRGYASVVFQRMLDAADFGVTANPQGKRGK